MAERKAGWYIYAPGQFVGKCRKIGTNSLVVTIPKGVVNTMGLRPGMDLMVSVERAKPTQIAKEEGEE